MVVYAVASPSNSTASQIALTEEVAPVEQQHCSTSTTFSAVDPPTTSTAMETGTAGAGEGGSLSLNPPQQQSSTQQQEGGGGEHHHRHQHRSKTIPNTATTSAAGAPSVIDTINSNRKTSGSLVSKPTMVDKQARRMHRRIGGIIAAAAPRPAATQAQQQLEAGAGGTGGEIGTTPTTAMVSDYGTFGKQLYLWLQKPDF